MNRHRYKIIKQSFFTLLFFGISSLAAAEITPPAQWTANGETIFRLLSGTAGWIIGAISLLALLLRRRRMNLREKTEKEKERKYRDMNLLLERAAYLAKITYFTGSKDMKIRIIGGNADIGLPPDHGQGHPLPEWIIPEDREKLKQYEPHPMNQNMEADEIICRSDATGERRSYRMAVMRDAANQDLYIGVLQDISASIAMEAKQKELIRSLNNYVENERIINAGLSQIVKEENFEKKIDEILRIIATQLSSDRAYFGVFENPARNYHFSREWLNENVPSLKTIRDPRFYCQFGKWYERFANDELLIIPDIPNSQYAEVLKEPGCKTLMCAPIRVDRKLYGLLGIGFIRERREVSELDQSILRSAARLIALAKEHQLQREALDSLDRQNRIIFNTLPVPICLFNGKGELLRCNPAAAAFSNAAQTEMLQKPCYKSLCGFDSVPDICPVRHVLENGSQYTHEIETNGHDCLVTATPIRNREGAITHVLESAIDLTEINESKRQLEIAMRAAQAADRAKSYFLATMSHELRTPLNAVIGFSELLKGSHMSETEQKEALDAIQEAGSTLLELINDVLDLSKLEADKMDLAPEFLNVKEFLNNIAKIFLSLAKSKNLKFRLDFSETLPRQLKFDRKRLRQVLVNILGNAFKFTETGGITFTAGFHAESEKHGDFTVAIRDTGPGMSQEEINELFVPFKQHHVRDAEGTGLGLVISRRLTERMGGRIEVESESGKGTAFSIHLPAVEYSNPVPAVSGEDQAAAPLSPSRLPERVMIVDDVPVNLKILAAMLKQLGIESIPAGSAKEALEQLKIRKPEMILTDLWMPEMNGTELAEHLAKSPDTAGIPVFAITADSQALGNLPETFSGILLKPVTLAALRKSLQEFPPTGK